MATRGQTHQKRAREVARKERRELKQVKKAQRAAGELPMPDGEDTESSTARRDGHRDRARAEAEPAADEGWIQ